MCNVHGDKATSLTLPQTFNAHVTPKYECQEIIENNTAILDYGRQREGTARKHRLQESNDPQPIPDEKVRCQGPIQTRVRQGG